MAMSSRDTGRRCVLRLAAAALALTGGIGTAAGINIDTCGVRVPDGEVAVLTTDLNCPAETRGVTLGGGATLNLNGHSIAVPDGWGVWCVAAQRCIITGGGGFGPAGEIRGAETGVYLQNRARAKISSVSVRDCKVGIGAEDWHRGVFGASARLANISVSGSSAAGIQVGKVHAENVIVADNPGNGIVAAPSSGRLKAIGLTVTRNATSAICASVGCEGINVGSLIGRGLSVTDNAGVGIQALKLKLRSSIVVENRRLGTLKDLVIANRPRLKDVACSASFGWNASSATPWGVCALDDSN